MPDNWGYVAAAYLVAALMLGAYWRHLIRRASELARPRTTRRPRGEARAWPASNPPARQ
jgi:hypothetical protein